MAIMHKSNKQVVTVENEWYLVSVDTYGRLVHLERKGSGYGNIIGHKVPSLFRAVLKQGANWEDVQGVEDQQFEVFSQGAFLYVKTSHLYQRQIEVVLTLHLDGSFLHFDADVSNNDTCMVTDVYFPCLGGIKTLKGGQPGLLWPDCTGQWMENVASHIGKQSEFGGTQLLSATYPGPLSMQWMSLVDGDEVLYYAGHDELFHTSSLRVLSVEQDKDRLIGLESDKMAFVKAGEQWHHPECVVSLYQGSWREGADEYATWTKTWRNPVEKARWIEDMNGYFLVICKQQYGDELWLYKTIPDLYAYAKEFGCDTVGLFGWYDSGHDNQYPDLSVSSSLGGEVALKEGIAKVQAAGGHVTLYYQGHLIDVNSPFYESKGKALEGRNIWDTPYYEDYSKSFSSDFLKFFSKKKFSTVCPSCPEWHDLMTEKAKWVASFGPDGILYDQIGGMPAYPCFNENHPHMQNRPSLSYTQGRLKLLKKIHDQVRSLSEGFAFMTEHETDVYSQFPDALHGIGVCPMPRTGKKSGNSWTSMSSTAPQMFRYCFPETILTLRNPNPFLSPRYVNYALLYGFRFELEIRYLGDKQVLESNERGEWKSYACKVAALRKKYGDMLLKGTYKEQAGVKITNPLVSISLFEGKGRSCIVLWNDTLSEQSFEVFPERKTIIGWESVNAEGKGPVTSIPAESVMVLLLS